MYATVNGTRLFFDIDGAGTSWRDGTSGVSRPVLLLLPGGPGSSHLTYKNPLYGFTVLPRVFQTIYVDWRGAGASEPAPPETLTVAQAVADVEALRVHLGIDDWVVMGASAGGIWALSYAATHPEHTSLVIAVHCAASGATFGDMAERNARRAGITDPDDLRIYRAFVDGSLTGEVQEWATSLRRTIMRTQQALYVDPGRHPEAVEDHQRRWDTLPGPELLTELDSARWYLRDMAANYRADQLGLAIRCPAFIATGAADPVAPAEDARAIAAAITNAELYIHSGRHLPLGVEQGDFWNHVGGFLDRHGINASALVTRPG